MLIHQSDSVLARGGTPNSQHAVWLEGGKATALPRLDGGTSFVGATRVGDRTYALVGHNTSHYDGDLWDTTHEVDVCVLDPKQPVVEIATRSLPARYAGKAKTFWEVAGTYDKMTWQILDAVGSPPMVNVNVDEDGGTDVERLRARVREVHKTVTRVLDDDELITRMDWTDGRSAVYRWRRERLRGRATAGIGDIHVTDAADFDLDIANAVVEKVDGDKHIHCAGTLTNLRQVTLVDLEVRCIAGDRDRIIKIAKLDPKQSHEFTQTFDAGDDDYLVIEVFRGRTQQVLRDLTVETKNLDLYNFFVEIHSATGLALREHEFTDKRFFVGLQTPPKTSMNQVDTAEVAAAFKRIDEARTRLGGTPGLELELQVYVDRHLYYWDGSDLVLNE